MTIQIARGNPLFPISSKGSFISTIPETGLHMYTSITTAFVTLVVYFYYLCEQNLFNVVVLIVELNYYYYIY